MDLSGGFMPNFRLWVVVIACLALVACGDEPQQKVAESTAQAKPVAAPGPKPVAAEAGQPAQGFSAGGVSVRILPEDPTSTGCLTAEIQGRPGRSAVIWSVNGTQITAGTNSNLCSDSYKRGDTVTVAVGTNDAGAATSVEIGNSPPRVVDISSTPEQIYSGADVTVTPVAEDVDGDLVDFSYQWLVNGNAIPQLTEATLPGAAFTKGDTIQVLITPNDFFADGPVYESFAMPVPDAPPTIVSQPPQAITSLDYRYQVEVSDSDDTRFTFRLDEAPAGMTIDAATGLISWSLENVEPGSYTIAIIAADSDGAETAQEYTLTLSRQ
jgi:hypothetical protein